ncbi:MAG: response regulator [Opitutus sp.]|nr:response regulator [Opitutus sp.]
MLPTMTPIFCLAAAVGETNWFAVVTVAVGVITIGLLVLQLWRAQRHYALELAEQSRQVAVEQEKSNRVQQEMESVARESQAKSEMLATLSREIRSHLNGIIGSADLLIDNTLKPQQLEHLTTLRSSAESLHQSLNDVLDYSSVETGQIQISNAPFDLRQPLIEAVETLSPLALLKRLELVLIIAPDVPSQVLGDAGRLRQILLNLMSNSVKFTVIGRVVLRVELHQRPATPPTPGATWLRFSVSDTGAGIPEAKQAAIFDRSAEADAHSTRRFGGSGLELVISKRLVELMGGQIGARTLPEGGSEFWVILALPVEKAPERTPVEYSDELHVVVLDDLAASRIAASAMLTRLGIDQDATATVSDAVGLLNDAVEAKATQRVLLLDESVAEESGAELARLLALDSTLRSTRVVLMARDPERADTTALKFPIAAVVRKPLLRADALLDALSAPAPVDPAKPDSRSPFDASGAPIRRGPYVLVVDDDTISRSVSFQLLERLGCVAEVAVSGAEAVERLGNARFDLIFMDCQMPEMDGFEATKIIRTAAGAKAPPIVALTANISGPDRAKCFAVGMCDFVSKPVNKMELARVLKRWVPQKAANVK